MKKLIFSAALLLSLVLVACGEEEEATDVSTASATVKETTATEETAVEESKEDVKTESEEVKSGTLTKAGQWTMDGDDKVTLVKIAELNKTYPMGPINLTIESVKLLHHSNVDSYTKEYVKNVHGKEVSELGTIQVTYSVENTADRNVMFTSIDTLTTDTKAQILGMHDMANSNDLGTYMGQVIVEGLSIFPYFGEDLGEISVVNLMTSNAFDSDDGETLSEAQKIEIQF